MSKVILAIDAGTTASKAAIVSLSGRILGLGRAGVVTRFGPGGRAVQDPEQIVSAQRRAVFDALAAAGRVEIVAAGIASQRSTFVIWDSVTGRSSCPAPTWQDTSGESVCHALKREAGRVRRLTGLPLSPHYSASKIPAALRQARSSDGRSKRSSLRFGSVATWLIWRLTRERIHATEPTQAARTLLMNLSSLRWEERLLSMFRVPRSILPEIRPGIGSFGTIRAGTQHVPVLASLGDQQAALFSHLRIDSPLRDRPAVVNYGTGAFVLAPTGATRMTCPGLLSSIAWTTASARRYLLEGTVNAAGATLDWLRREFGAPEHLDAVDRLCREASGSCFMLAAFGRLGSMWDEEGRGSLPSLIAGATARGALADLTCAAVESLAFMVGVNLAAIAARTGDGVGRVLLTGPLSRLSYLAGFQAALCAPTRVEVSLAPEATLIGIARAAAFGRGGDISRAAARWVVPAKEVRPERALVSEAGRRRRSWLRLCQLARRLGDRTEPGR